MVIRQRTGKSIYGALKYNYDKKEVSASRVIYTNNVLEDNSGRAFSYLLDSFTPYLERNIQTEKPIVHISINPHPEDRIGEDDYCRIIDEYMERMGYGEQPYVVFLHEDIDRKHLHVVTTCVGLDGKKINLDYDQRRSKRIRDDLMKKYDLRPFDGKAHKGKLSKTLEYKDSNIKSQIKSIGLSVFDQYRFSSLSDLNAILNCYNIGVRETKGVAGKGKTPSRGLLYQALDKDGKPVGVPLKASTLGEEFKIPNLEGLCGKYGPGLKNLRQRKELAAKIRTAIGSDRSPGAMSEQEVRERLEKAGVSVVFRRNDEGRLYGVTFIDHEQKAAYKGSSLGKDLAANEFYGMFSQASHPTTEDAITSPERGGTDGGPLENAGDIEQIFRRGWVEYEHTDWEEWPKYRELPNLSGLWQESKPVYEYIDPVLRGKKKKKKRRFKK